MGYARFPTLVTTFFFHRNVRAAASDVSAMSAPKWSIVNVISKQK